MEVAPGSVRAGPPLQFPSRTEWRAVSELYGRNTCSEEVERSKLGQPDERTIYEVQRGQVGVDGVEFCSIQIDSIMGSNYGVLQQRIQSIDRKREELQQMEIELRAHMIAKSEIMEIQSKFEGRLKEQANVSARLQEQLREREQTIYELERQMEEKERELHAVRLDNEAAWAKEDLLKEQNQELATFRRERDSIEAERAHHMKQIHDLQEHLQDRERQLLNLQEQNSVAKETILYKDEQIRDAQSWMARVQEIDVLQSSTLQAELRERTEQYNQLWLGCQRQFAEMEMLHVQATQRLQLELAGARGKSETYDAESSISQNGTSDGCNVGSSSGHHTEANGGGMKNGSSGSLSNGIISDNSEALVSSGNAPTQTNHVSTFPNTAASILGMPSYLPPGQVTAVHQYAMHQQGVNHSVLSHVAQSYGNQFHPVPEMASFQQWPNHQAVSEGPPISSPYQYTMSQTEENSARPGSNYSYELSTNGVDMPPDYLHAHANHIVKPNSHMFPSEEAKNVESMEKSYLVSAETQHSLQQISSQFSEALRLEPHNQAVEIKAQESNATGIGGNKPPNPELATELGSAALVSLSEASGYPVHISDAMVDGGVDAASSEVFVSAGSANSLLTGTRAETALLDERALLACIVRTIPAGGQIRISSTLPNRLGRMIAPLHWHDYKKKFGKIDDFVASHPELFVIEGDYIQLREGAQGIIAATAAVAKVAAAASSPYSSFFPSVAVTPMAQVDRVKNISSFESKRVRNSADCRHSLAIQSSHLNSSGFNTSGGLPYVRILSKSKDPFELNVTDVRSGQPLVVPAQNGLHSDRSVLLNPQSEGGIHAMAGANFVGQQQNRNVFRG